MTGYTIPDSLPYPDDYTQPADSPAALQSLATATQAALDKKTIVEHTHSPNMISIGRTTNMTINPGATASVNIAVPAGAWVMATAEYPQATLAVAVQQVSSTQWTIRIKNNGTNTPTGARAVFMVVLP